MFIFEWIIIILYYCDVLEGAKHKNVVQLPTQSSIQDIYKSDKSFSSRISPETLQSWAKELSDRLHTKEQHVVRPNDILRSFSSMKQGVRNGSAIVDQMANAMDGLLKKRIKAATAIMRKAEELASRNEKPPAGYTFDHSVNLDVIKKKEDVIVGVTENNTEIFCRSMDKVVTPPLAHFNASATLDVSSVHTSSEVNECYPAVLDSIYWTQDLLSTYKSNYEADASMDFQYFCSAKGFLRHYPAALWSSLFNLKIEVDDVYDCRLRPWYVAAGGAPRDMLILLDGSGSTNNSNIFIAHHFVLALLTALSDDDQVNVLRYNNTVHSPVKCFTDKLVSANHVNAAAMVEAMKSYKPSFHVNMSTVFSYAVRLLEKQRTLPTRAPPCQQAIILVTDAIEQNHTELLQTLDPEGNIRVFVMWLHDRYGLRDSSREYGGWLGCSRDAYLAELVTPSDVTEQVMNILRIMERPLVAQREQRPPIFSDVYAHLEDPRRHEEYWKLKENEEQAFRYWELRRDKKELLSNERRYSDHMHQVSLDQFGHYMEEELVNYRLEISVAVPVFESTTFEKIQITLDEEKKRNSTRIYPVNRLLGVAGADIPIDHLKLLLPYHKIGAGGSIFIFDHRGNVILHENFRPTFEGDILKPGYRTVDFLDVEQPAVDHRPREFPKNWLQFRSEMLMEKPSGNRTMYGKHISRDGMVSILEMREYHWRRVHDHYTTVVVLPTYNRLFVGNDLSFSQKLAEDALKALAGTDFNVDPDRLYCRHVDPFFDNRKDELLHFLRRRKDEENFQLIKLKHKLSPYPPTLLEKTYQCNEEAIAHISADAVATEQWARAHETSDEGLDCAGCQLGSTTSFLITESGLTRWHEHHVTSSHSPPPNGEWWYRLSETAFARAAASSSMVIHAPRNRIVRRRNSDAPPPPLDVRRQWLTAARALRTPNDAFVAVAGFHFHPQHLEDLLQAIVNPHCTELDPRFCQPRCDEEFDCVLVDEGGWLVGGAPPHDGRRAKHLAHRFPGALAALLDARVFKLHWVHDYQAVCFPYNNKGNSASRMVPNILKAALKSLRFIFQSSRDLIAIIYLLSFSVETHAETEKDKLKRRNHIKKDMDRESYDMLFDKRVLVNRTTAAACDRSRPHYFLQLNPTTRAILQRPSVNCSWPLMAAIVPQTNLLLLAIRRDCPSSLRSVPDPLLNQPTVQTSANGTEKNDTLACAQNRSHSQPSRAPHVPCFAHSYQQEEGYRQCGPWLPDEEEEKVNGAKTYTIHSIIVHITCLINFIHLF